MSLVASRARMRVQLAAEPLVFFSSASLFALHPFHHAHQPLQFFLEPIDRLELDASRRSLCHSLAESHQR